jgi:hypothetical protein
MSVTISWSVVTSLRLPAKHQHQRHDGPGDFFAALGQCSVEKLFQPQLPHQFQPQPRAAKVAAVLHPHPRRIHFHPLRLDVVEQPALSATSMAFSGVLHTQATSFIELPQIRHHALTRTSLGAMRLHQRPIGMTFAILSSITRANKHARYCNPESPLSNLKVFTTTPFSQTAKTSKHDPKELATRNPASLRESNMTRFPLTEPLLANLG